MKKGSRLFAFVLFALVFGMFMSNFVSAISVSPKDFLDKGINVFTKWQDGDKSLAGENITKYLVWLIVGLIVFAILSKIPLLEGDNFTWLRSILAIVISFLSIAYLTPSDLYVALASYNAMGVIIAGIIPFIVIAYFSTSIVGSNPAAKLLSKFIWAGFVIYLIYKLIYGYNSDLISPAVAWTYIGLIIAAILYAFIFEKKLMALMFKEEIAQSVENLEKSSKRTALADAALNRNRANALRDAGEEAAADELERAAERLEKNIKK